MSTMSVVWVRMGSGFPYDGAGENIVKTVVERETVTTSGTSAQSGVAPEGVNAVIVHAVDADLIVYSSDNPTASPTLGIDVPLGQKEVFSVPNIGGTKVAGIER